MELYDLKEYLHIALDDYSYDALLNTLYSNAKHLFTDLTSISLSNTAEVVFTYYNLENMSVFCLPVFPVNSVDKIEYKTYFSSIVTELPTSDYDVQDNRIYFKNSHTFYFLRITADTGYSVIPDNIDKLLAQIVHYYFNYQALNIHLSSNGEVPLMPEQATLPKFLYDQIRAYRKFF